MQTEVRPESHTLHAKLCDLIPGGVNSPVRSCQAMGQLPMIVERGIGDLLYDADGNSYIDYCGSWGALIHGHAHPQIVAAASARMQMGSSFGISCPVEAEIADTICRLLPSIEKIRFVSSGTEATMTAARLARGFTGRNLIVKFDGNYHGHADFFLVRAGSGVMNLNSESSSAGIPSATVSNTISLPYNDQEACRRLLTHPGYRDQIACVILEPIAANMGLVPATREFIQMLRSVTEQIGALLIFDEVISGFRAGIEGAQGYYGVNPDLTCLGKIIGGGFPAAAFGGREEIMNQLAPLGPVYQAGTLSGNPVAMQAGLAALQLLEKPGFYETLERKTQLLTAPIEAYLADNPHLQACLQRHGSMFTLFFGRRSVNDAVEAKLCDGSQFADFFRYLFAAGVYIPPLQWEAWFVSMAHSEDHLLKTRDLVLSYLERL